MGNGIFAEVSVRGSTSCRLPTTGSEAIVGSVTRSTVQDGGVITEEFTVEKAARGTDAEAAIDGVEGVTRVFDSGSGTVYRFDREQHGCV